MERKAWNEATFQGHVNRLCGVNGWLWYHTHRSDRSPSGFPDLIAIRGLHIVVAELKAFDRRGRLNRPTAAQLTWLTAFRAIGTALRGLAVVGVHMVTLDVYEWNPTHWDTITEVLAA